MGLKCTYCPYWGSLRYDTVLEGPGVGFGCILMKEGPRRRNKLKSLGWVILPFCSCPPSALSFGLCAFWDFSFHCLPCLSFWKAQVFQNNILRFLQDLWCSFTLVHSPLAWQVLFFCISPSQQQWFAHSPFLIFHGDKIQWFSCMEACWHWTGVCFTHLNLHKAGIRADGFPWLLRVWSWAGTSSSPSPLAALPKSTETMGADGFLLGQGHFSPYTHSKAPIPLLPVWANIPAPGRQENIPEQLCVLPLECLSHSHFHMATAAAPVPISEFWVCYRKVFLGVWCSGSSGHGAGAAWAQCLLLHLQCQRLNPVSLWNLLFLPLPGSVWEAAHTCTKILIIFPVFSYRVYSQLECKGMC